MDNGEKILFTLLGWILGLLSPIIVDSIRRHRDIREIRAALKIEIHEMKYRLAIVAYMVEEHYGDVNRQFLEWLKPILQGYTGINPVNSILKIVETQLALTDDQIKAFAQLEKAGPEKGFSLKKYYLHFLDTRITLLSSLTSKLQNQLLELKTYLSILNEEVDQARYYDRLTFQNNISNENYARAIENVDKSYRSIGNRARIIVDIIDKIKL